LDVASRRVLGFSLGERHDAQLAYGALAMAVAVRGGRCPAWSSTPDQRVLGADHPDTLASRNNLAGAYQSAGDLGRAIPLYKAGSPTRT
jgi:hypothetical protein